MFRDHVIFFKHMGAGDTVPGPDPNHILVSALYRITKGAGVFKGASGVLSVTGEVELKEGKLNFEISGYLYHEKPME